MGFSRKINHPFDQDSNDNKQEQNQDYQSMNKSSGFLHDYNGRDHISSEPFNDDHFLCKGTNHDDIQEGRRLNLVLTISESLIRKIEFALTQEKQQKMHQEVLSQPQLPPSKEKEKASNLRAMFFKVGFWSRESKNPADLVVKFYYGKKKLVWEFLFGSLKKKMEILWTQVSAINAYVDDDKMGRLEIELKEPPEYYKEYKFQRLKHTQWEKSDDFTEGQASVYRRHSIRFHPGILDDDFEKLIQYDNRLSNLSRQPFPIQNSPFFELSYNVMGYTCPPLPLTTLDHQGTMLPYVQNHMQPTSSFVGQSCSSLTIPGPTFPNSDDYQLITDQQLEQFISDQIKADSTCKALEPNDQINYDLSGNMMISDDNHHVDQYLQNTTTTTTQPPITEQDHNEVFGELEQLIPDEQLELLNDNTNLEVATQQNCFKVDSTCKPFEQNHQMNSNPPGDSISNENYGLPLTDDQLRSSSGERNKFEYIDNDVCRFAEQQFNDLFVMPFSWLPSDTGGTPKL